MNLEEQVMQAVARGWCDPRNAHKEMDVDLAEAITAEVVRSFSPRPDSMPDTAAPKWDGSFGPGQYEGDEDCCPQ